MAGELADVKVEIENRKAVRSTGLTARWHAESVLLEGYTFDGRYITVTLDIVDLQEIPYSYLCEMCGATSTGE